MLGVALCAPAIHATVIVPAEFREVVDGSDLIAYGRVIDVHPEWADGRRRIDSIVTVDVMSWFKGGNESTLSFVVPGGEIGRYRQVMIGAPVFKPGDEAFLFLKTPGRRDAVRVRSQSGRVSSQRRSSAACAKSSRPCCWLPARTREVVRRGAVTSAAAGARCVWRADPNRDGRRQGGRALKASRRLAVVVALVIAFGAPAAAYLKLGTRVGGRTVTLGMAAVPDPLLHHQSGRGWSHGAAAFDRGAARVSTWHAVPNTQTSSNFVGFTQASPTSGDGATVLGFQNRPELDRTLAATNFFIDSTTGEIVESDIFFNSAVHLVHRRTPASRGASTSSPSRCTRSDISSASRIPLWARPSCASGGRRVLGAEAVMFPIAFSAGDISDRRLKADDVAGFSDIYGNQTFQRQTGSVSGRVTKNGKGVLGAHVVAFNPASGKLVGGFTLSDDGAFVIAGLEPGPQVLRAEPLDDGDVSSFFDATMNIDAEFQVKFYEKVVIVPKGGGTRNIEIKVLPK